MVNAYFQRSSWYFLATNNVPWLPLVEFILPALAPLLRVEFLTNEHPITGLVVKLDCFALFIYLHSVIISVVSIELLKAEVD